MPVFLFPFVFVEIKLLFLFIFFLDWYRVSDLADGSWNVAGGRPSGSRSTHTARRKGERRMATGTFLSVVCVLVCVSVC